MKTSRDPVRWTERGSDAGGELVDAMRALRAGRGSASQVEALGRRLAPQLATPTQALGGSGASLWIKLGLSLLLSGAIGFYALTHRDRGRSHAALRPPVRQPAVEPVATATPAAPAPPSARAVPAAVPAPAPRRSGRVASRPHRVDPPVPLAPAPAPAPEAELALLQRSQVALDRDPSAALALAEEHARVHPRGVFAQEREILAIEALLKQRRTGVALTRAEQFVANYPESPHSRRVRALLARARSLDPATNQGATDHSEDVPVRDGGGHDPK